MKLLNRLERKFGRWAVPNLTTILIVGQVMLCVLQAMQAGRGMGGNGLGRLELLPSAVMEGEVWRLVTFLFIPPGSISIFTIFYWLIFYRFGNELELQWGVVRYNAFLLIGYLANVVAVFIAWGLGTDIYADNYFLYGTVFLAFARLFPTYVIHIFLILPVQLKWLALLMWVGYGYSFLIGNGMSRMLILASVLNYLLFFGHEHWRDFKSGHRRRAFQAKVSKSSQSIQHQCRVCELNSENSPRMLFRYCSKCEGQCCYCPEHIQDHEHVTADEAAAT